MNLIEENFQNKQEKNSKTASKIVLICIILLIMAIISIASYLVYIQNTTLALFLNGQANEKIKELLVIEDDGTIYLPIKQVASYFGYDSYNGEYSDKSEDKNKCYIQSKDGKEVANFTVNSNKVYKLNLTGTTDNYEYVYSEKPVKASEGVLYATSEMIEKAFNISFEYNKDKNTINILTMPYLIQIYSKKIIDYGYTEISDIFDNQKIILEGMLVVEKNNKYAVIDIKGNAILEPKYDDIVYLPNVGDFLVESNEKVGIISKNGETKVQIIYDSIKLMDSDLELYVVQKENKYGVIDFNGNTKIYIENDEIGMDISKFEKNNIKNKYLLGGNLIPVRKENLWGLYDKNGKKVVDFQYDSFGYINTTEKNVFNLLIIPDYNVIVACKEQKYTLINLTGQELFVGAVADEIYMTIKDNTRYYHIAVNDETIDATVYLDKIGVSINPDTNN